MIFHFFHVCLQVKIAHIVQHRGEDLEVTAVSSVLFPFECLFSLAGSITGLEGRLFFLPLQ